ncbi:MAG: hypothetical protein WBM09_07725 [Gallionella sp.]
MEDPEIPCFGLFAARFASDFARIKAIPQNRNPDSPVEHFIASLFGNSRPDLFFAAIFFHDRTVFQHGESWPAVN